MKKMTFLACAAVLTSAIALTSCKSDDPNVIYEGDAEVVKTEFAISLPGSVVGGPNKMKSTTAQTDPSKFQGMTSIMLVPFATSDSIKGADTRLGKNVKLTGDVTTSGEGSLGTNSKAKVYTDVAIPLTTASFLFYGKSAATGTKYEVGSLIPDTASALNTPAEFAFKLDSIQTTAAMNTVMTSGIGKNLLDWLTSIAAANTGASTKSWYQYPTTGDSAAYNAMFQAYSSLTYLSSNGIANMLTDLYTSLLPLSSPIATSIKAAIAAGSTYAYVNTTTGAVDMKSGYDKFPVVYGLPEGAVGIKWDTDHFAHMSDGEYTAANRTPLNKYVYPANLWYYANSTIKTSNTSKKGLYDNTNTWVYILSQHTDATAVNTLTRAVALVDSVQYGVARLDVQVRLANDGGTLADNSEAAEGVAKPVNVSAGLPISAVLVGGQNHVGYNFQPSAAGTYTVYDTVMATTMTAMPRSVYTDKNHTLVLESFAGSDVRVAIEMTNTTGADFYGADKQLIPAGGKFYVVANLTAAAATETGSKVFKQDYTTTAKLILTDLKKAYNTIPDLRTPQLEIGFAVDLSWKTGHTYETTFE